MSGDEGSLFDQLGISRESFLPDPPEDVWSTALTHAVDPDSNSADDTLVPSMDDTVRAEGNADDLMSLGEGDTVDSEFVDIHPHPEHFDDLDVPHDSNDDDYGADEIDLGDGV